MNISQLRIGQRCAYKEGGEIYEIVGLSYDCVTVFYDSCHYEHTLDPLDTQFFFELYDVLPTEEDKAIDALIKSGARYCR